VQDPGGKFQTDPIGQPANPLIGQAAPFVLSTPHHSMAWAQDQPGAFQASVAQVESELTQFAAAIAEREEAQRNGSLPAAAADELAQLRREYEGLLAEYQQLVQGVGVGSGGAG
jgi:hypothetical protein